MSDQFKLQSETRGGKRKSGSSSKISIYTTIITTIGLIIAAFLGGPAFVEYLKGVLPASAPLSTTVAVRVAEKDGKSVSGVKVILFSKSETNVEMSDTNGTARFTLQTKLNGKARLIVESNDHEIFEEEFELSNGLLKDIKLVQKSVENTASEAKILFRVVDSSNKNPVPNAQISLIVGGDTYSQPTDSFGIAAFAIAFPKVEKLSANMTIITKDYEVKQQNITLLPDKFQDVLLDAKNSTISFTDVMPQEVNEELPTPEQDNFAKSKVSSDEPIPCEVISGNSIKLSDARNCRLKVDAISFDGYNKENKVIITAIDFINGEIRVNFDATVSLH